jgi:hypothetical protein
MNREFFLSTKMNIRTIIELSYQAGKGGSFPASWPKSAFLRIQRGLVTIVRLQSGVSLRIK